MYIFKKKKLFYLSEADFIEESSNGPIDFKQFKFEGANYDDD